jgi:hypothetical protein
LVPIDEPPLALTTDAAPRAPVSPAATDAGGAVPAPRGLFARGWPVAVLFVGSFAACVLAYLAIAVPGSWFPGAAPKAWAAGSLTLARGVGSVVGDELVVDAPDASGMVLVSVIGKFRSSDYPAVAWAAIGVPDSAVVRLLWFSDYTPQTLSSAPVAIEAGRPLPTLVAGDRGWVGNISGLALAIQGPLTQPLRIRGVVAKPMGAAEILGDRAREWLAFEGWTGASINTVVGGADIQELSLPALLAAAVALATAIAWLLRRSAMRWRPLPIAAVLAALFVAASLVLDARWTANLARQVHATWVQYAGKSARDRYLASDDAAVYAFTEKARGVLPAAPARVFVVADADYFRNRAAYHLYPHNVYFDPRANTVPPASALRPGDWLVVYQRRGVQYSAAEQRLRWDDGQSVAAELKLVDAPGALFLIR